MDTQEKYEYEFNHAYHNVAELLVMYTGVDMVDINVTRTLSDLGLSHLERIQLRLKLQELFDEMDEFTDDEFNGFPNTSVGRLVDMILQKRGIEIAPPQ